MVMENSFIHKERSTMGCGDMIKHMGKELISTQMERNIMEVGTKICSLDLARNSGQIHHNLPDGIEKVEKMVLESICGLMEPFMRANGKRTR